MEWVPTLSKKKGNGKVETEYRQLVQEVLLLRRNWAIAGDLEGVRRFGLQDTGGRLATQRSTGQ